MNRRELLAYAATGPAALRAALLAPAATALVTCDAQSRLAVVDLGTFRATRSIGTLPDPRSIERVGSFAVVCHTAIGALSIIDGQGVRHVVRGFVEPRYVAAHPDGRHALVTDSGRSGVSAVDVVRGRVVGRVRLPGWARHITIDADGRRLWVALGSASPQVAVVDVSPFRRVEILEPGFGAHDVGIAPDGRLWVTAGAARQLAVAGRVEAAERAPQHVTFGDGRAFVTSGDAGELRVHALDGRVLRRTPIPRGSYNVQYGSGRVITASLTHGTLTVLDRNGALLERVQVADSCHDACFQPL